jgi:hypothetical protein
MTAMTFDSDLARYGALLRLFRRVGIIAVVAALFLAVHHQLTDVKDLFLRLFSPSPIVCAPTEPTLPDTKAVGSA